MLWCVRASTRCVVSAALQVFVTIVSPLDSPVGLGGVVNESRFLSRWWSSISVCCNGAFWGGLSQLMRASSARTSLKFMIVLLAVVLPGSVIVYETNLRATGIAQPMLWSIQPGVFGALAVAPDAEKLVFTSVPGGSNDEFLVIDPTTGQYNTVPAAGQENVRMAVSESSRPGQDILIGGYQNFWALRLDGSVLWELPFGCCNVPHSPPAIDFSRLAAARANQSNGFAEFDLTTGAQIGPNISAIDGYLSIASSTNMYNASTESSGVASINPSTGGMNFDFVGIGGPGSVRPPAIAADGSAIVTTGSDHFTGGPAINPGDLARVNTSGTVLWDVAVNAVTPPVIAANGTIFIGTETPSSSNGAIEAHDPNSGALLWTQPVVGTPNDLVVADNGQVYAIAGDPNQALTGALDGFDQVSGAPTLNITDVPGGYELILQNGVIYTSGPSVTAIEVPANGYDPNSPWPVRFHDNQRTGSAQAPLNLGNFPGVLIVNTISDETVSGDGFCSLREAINNSNSPGTDTTGGDCAIGTGTDVITFSVSGTITLGSTLPAIANTTTIDGTGQTITVDGASSYQVLLVNSGASLNLQNLTVADGFVAGGGHGGGIFNRDR